MVGLCPHIHGRLTQAFSSSLMYQHRSDRERVDVVDLDPYGTAAPFIDASVQCVKDGGKVVSSGVYTKLTFS